MELFCQCKCIKRYIAAAKLKKQQQQDEDFPVEEDEVKAAAGPTYSMEVIVLGGAGGRVGGSAASLYRSLPVVSFLSPFPSHQLYSVT